MSTATSTLADQVRARLADTALRIGTRTTPLALAQTDRVVTDLRRVLPDVPVEVVEITTSADLWTGDLSQLGGKGNFTKEIDRALITSRIDIAVHSMKDVPGDVPLPAGTEFGAYLERGDVHDVVITRDSRKLADLQPGAKVGTSSGRRWRGPGWRGSAWTAGSPRYCPPSGPAAPPSPWSPPSARP